MGALGTEAKRMLPRTMTSPATNSATRPLATMLMLPVMLMSLR